MSQKAGFQVSLDVKGRHCLVLGGDDEAAHKAMQLFNAEAKVIIVNPTINTTLKKLTASGKVIHRGRRFRSTDTQGVFLILNSIRDDTDLSKSLFELAKTERFLVWSVDQPQVSNFTMPAIVSRGPLRIAISTSGTSPALSSALRKNLEQIFDDEFVNYLDWLGDLRKDLQENEPSESQRKAKLKEAVRGFQLVATLEYASSWLEQKKRSIA